MGACYIIGSAPTGEWAGKSNCLAGYTSGGWRFIDPIEGLNAYVKSSGTWANYRSGAWEIGTVRGASVVLDGVQVIGPQLAAISAATGGTNVDAEARVSISQILAALRQHGLIET